MINRGKGGFQKRPSVGASLVVVLVTVCCGCKESGVKRGVFEGVQNAQVKGSVRDGTSWMISFLGSVGDKEMVGA